MYEIELSNSFKKSFKKLNKKDKNTFREIALKLANNEILEQKYKDHALQGKLKDFRECHLRADLLLIYQINNHRLVLYCLDIGSHSDLFK